MSNGASNVTIFAVVTERPDRVHAGGCPVFVAGDAAERERIALWLSRITGAAAHHLDEGSGVSILVVGGGQNL